jgi:hypothetical protein
MSRLPRPYIPIPVRLWVIDRQLRAAGLEVNCLEMSLSAALKVKLRWLFGDEPIHLDHDPALENRAFNPRTRKYTPDANDPDCLRYRPTAHEAEGSHHIKTHVRGDHGARSDTAEAKHWRTIERNRQRRAGKLPQKRKIPQRENPWGKQRKRWR